MTKLEALGCALAATELPNSREYVDSVWSIFSPARTSLYLSKVRVILEELREPNEFMCDAVRKADLLGGYGYGDECYSADPKEVWQAMIDAILAEKP